MRVSCIASTHIMVPESFSRDAFETRDLNIEPNRVLWYDAWHRKRGIYKGGIL